LAVGCVKVRALPFESAQAVTLLPLRVTVAA